MSTRKRSRMSQWAISPEDEKSFAQHRRGVLPSMKNNSAAGATSETEWRPHKIASRAFFGDPKTRFTPDFLDFVKQASRDSVRVRYVSHFCVYRFVILFAMDVIADMCVLFCWSIVCMRVLELLCGKNSVDKVKHFRLPRITIWNVILAILLQA
jgi:hypothetical protein